MTRHIQYQAHCFDFFPSLHLFGGLGLPFFRFPSLMLVSTCGREEGRFPGLSLDLCQERGRASRAEQTIFTHTNTPCKYHYFDSSRRPLGRRGDGRPCSRFSPVKLLVSPSPLPRRGPRGLAIASSFAGSDALLLWDGLFFFFFFVHSGTLGWEKGTGIGLRIPPLWTTLGTRLAGRL